MVFYVINPSLARTMTEKSTRKIVVGVLALLVLVPLALLGGSIKASATSAEGIIIPLYTYPGSTWDSVVTVKNAHPSVPIVAVINPASGPGYSYDNNYATGITKLKSAGVTVLGYVSTSYAGRSLSAVESDIDKYKSWYPNLGGIFFDEQSNVAGNEWFYSSANSYAKSQGFSFTVGNPGANTIPSYLNTVDLVLVYESPGTPDLSGYTSWMGYNKAHLGMIPFGVGSYPGSWVQSAENTVGWLYVTNDNLPNPWDTVTPFLGNLASAFDTGQGSGGSSGSTTLSVSTVDSAGNALPGYYTSLQAGSASQTGFSPVSFSVAQGNTYTVSVGDFGTYAFDHWQDGSTVRAKTLTVSSQVSLVAYMKNITPKQVPITVTSDSLSGSPVSGLWTTISSGGTVLKTGFTPLTYTANAGTTYQVTVANYQNDVFDHWQDGTKNSAVTVTPSAATTLTAYYQTGPTVVSVSVNSVGLTGSPVSGLWTVVTNSGGSTTTGFTPVAYTATAGSTLTVTVGDYQNYVFDHWANGSTSRTITLSPTSDTVLTAYYRQ